MLAHLADARVPSSRTQVCSTCATLRERQLFSKRQWTLGASRRCKECVLKFEDSGERGLIVMGEHRLSDGMVDGKKHRAPGRKVRDRSRRPSQCDFEHASQVIQSLHACFDLKADDYENLMAKPCKHVSVDERTRARVRFSTFHQLFPSTAVRSHLPQLVTTCQSFSQRSKDTIHQP